MSPKQLSRPLSAAALVGVALIASATPVSAQSDIVSWGAQVVSSAWNREAFTEITAGSGHTVARRADGSLVAWGSNIDGECDVPALPQGLTHFEIDAGAQFTAARRSDGSVVAWGSNSNGQCDVPALPPGLSYIEVSGGGGHAAGRRSVDTCSGVIAGFAVASRGRPRPRTGMPAAFRYAPIVSRRIPVAR